MSLYHPGEASPVEDPEGSFVSVVFIEGWWLRTCEVALV